MKQAPDAKAVQDTLREGILTRDGFMGDDPRDFASVIREDAEALEALGVTTEALADRMALLTKAGLAAAGAPVAIEGYEVVVEDYMGRIGCPFRDGRTPKRNTTATEPKERETMSWTDLSIHLIRKHGFFQGKGSPYRLEPRELARFLKLVK
jgi:hypothetical protein